MQKGGMQVVVALNVAARAPGGNVNDLQVLSFSGHTLWLAQKCVILIIFGDRETFTKLVLSKLLMLIINTVTILPAVLNPTTLGHNMAAGYKFALF